MSSPLDVTDANWQAEVIDSSTPVLVDFWAPWCGPCKMMGPSVDQIAGEFDGKLKVVKLNTQDCPDVAARYGIMSIPTFLVLKNGEVSHTISGAMPYPAFKEAVEPHV